MAVVVEVVLQQPARNQPPFDYFAAEKLRCFSCGCLLYSGNFSSGGSPEMGLSISLRLEQGW